MKPLFSQVVVDGNNNWYCGNFQLCKVESIHRFIAFSVIWTNIAFTNISRVFYVGSAKWLNSFLVGD